MPKAPRTSAGEHIFFLVVSGVFIVSCIVWAANKQAASQKMETPVEIDMAIESHMAATLGLTVSNGKEKGIMELTNDADWTAIHVPDAWTLREVRNGLLDQVTSTGSVGRFKRWTVPPKATVSFWMPSQFDRLVVHNSTSEHPLHLLFQDINVTTNASTSETFLLGERPVVIERQP